MKPAAIAMADLHLRDTVPQCYMGDYWKNQAECVSFIDNLQKEYSIPILCAGDLFDRAKSSPFLEGWAINNLPNNMFVIPGQHDLPNHSIELLEKSSLYVLASAGKIKILGMKNGIFKQFGAGGIPWGCDFDIDMETFDKQKRKILLLHYLVYQNKPKWDTQNKSTVAKSMLKKFPKWDIIVVGDNHLSFIEVYKDRLLVGPGSMMRMSTDQIDYKPRVYLWYAEDNHVEPVYLPIESNVISRKHIEKKKERDQKMEAFVERVKDSKEIGLSYEENLEKYFDTNKTRSPVKSFVWESINEKM